MKQVQLDISTDTLESIAKGSKFELFDEREGKALYHSGKPDLLIQEFKTQSSGDPKRGSRESDLSSLRNEISSYLFEYIEGFRIPTHFVGKLSPTSMVVRRTETVPLLLRVYNLPSISLTKRLGLKEGAGLAFPVIEHFYKQGKRAPAWVNEYHLSAFGIVLPDELKQMNRIASKANAILRGLCDRRDLILADLQLGFAKYKGQVVLGDELSPVTCHFLDAGRPDRRSADRYLPDQENAVEACSELYHKLRVKI